MYGYVYDTNSEIAPFGLNKNSNDTIGDWVLYKIEDPNTGIAKIGIGKAKDVMADGTNRRAHTSGRKVKKDANFSDVEVEILSTHNGISKGDMKEIEAAKVREFRELVMTCLIIIKKKINDIKLVLVVKESNRNNIL